MHALLCQPNSHIQANGLNEWARINVFFVLSLYSFALILYVYKQLSIALLKQLSIALLKQLCIALKLLLKLANIMCSRV